MCFVRKVEGREKGGDNLKLERAWVQYKMLDWWKMTNDCVRSSHLFLLRARDLSPSLHDCLANQPRPANEVLDNLIGSLDRPAEPLERLEQDEDRGKERSHRPRDKE